MFVCIYQQRKWFYYIMLVIINNVNLISSDADKCGDLPNPAHTKPLRDQSPPFEVGTKLTFDCKIGFVDSGIKSTAECILENNNAVWDIKSTCIGVTCGYPGDIENGQRIGDIFRFPENITYVCNPGYKIRGRAVSYCGTDGQWTDPPPKCIIKSCPNPQSPLNGHAAFTVTTYKSEVHYTCRKGFILSGPSKRLCQENEQWDGSEPTCIEVTCPEPLNVPGGYFISIKRGSAGSGKYIDGDIIYYYCNNSAKNVLVRCTNGNWIGMLPECDVDPSFTTISITTKQTTEKPTDIPGTQG
ncbi:protein lev-9-like [Centruroides sculpturatus]|uniref:protein lev-9-like n=1 Tax=Centruroides sculpturatus TaxID=218467 RepID=UPI000C6D5C09|nr:protein lev-9-like [Centruroides sculpturatus]